LEATGHQWFDRSTWPDDFKGHTGEIISTNGGRTLSWRNSAGVSWLLQVDLESGFLVIGDDNPYYESATREARDFTLVLGKGDKGAGKRKILGFRFLGELYVKQ
jgi:hypothetical protein